MPEPIVTTPPGDNPPTPPGDNPPTPPGGDDGKTVKLSADEYAQLKKAEGEYKDYKEKVDPVLETLWSDTELLTKATEVHNKRLGKVPATPTPPDDKKSVVPTPPVGDPDTRNAVINQISSDFEKEVGLDKLDAKQQQEVRGLVGQMLKEMLDPKGNKTTVSQVFEEVSLQKLPWYLRQAYKLINHNNDLKAAKEAGRNEILTEYDGSAGMIGSLAGGSVPIDEVTLSQKEREVAKRMGVSEEDYLKNKKDILKLQNS